MIHKITHVTQRLKFSHINEDEELVIPSHIGAAVLLGTILNGEFVVLWQDEPVPLSTLLQEVAATFLGLNPTNADTKMADLTGQLLASPKALLELDAAEKLEVEQVPAAVTDVVVLLCETEDKGVLQIPAHIVGAQPIMNAVETGDLEGTWPSAVNTQALIANSEALEGDEVSPTVSKVDPKIIGGLDTKTSGTDTLTYSVAPANANVRKTESRPQQLMVLVAEPIVPAGSFEDVLEAQGIFANGTAKTAPVAEGTAERKVLATTDGAPSVSDVDKAETREAVRPTTVVDSLVVDTLEQAGEGLILLTSDGTAVPIPVRKGAGNSAEALTADMSPRLIAVEKSMTGNIVATNVGASPVFRDAFGAETAMYVVPKLQNEPKRADAFSVESSETLAVLFEGNPQVIASTDYDGRGMLFAHPDSKAKNANTRGFYTKQVTGMPVVVFPDVPIATFDKQSNTLFLTNDAKLTLFSAQAESCERLLYTLPIQLVFSMSGTLKVRGMDVAAAVVSLSTDLADAQKEETADVIGAVAGVLRSLLPKLGIAPIAPTTVANAIIDASLADVINERNEQTAPGFAAPDPSLVDALNEDGEVACGALSNPEPLLSDILSLPIENAAGMSTGSDPSLVPPVDAVNSGASGGTCDMSWSWRYEIDDLDTAAVTAIDVLTINPAENINPDFHRSQLQAFDDYLVLKQDNE